MNLSFRLFLALSVTPLLVAQTKYQNDVMALNPLGFWPLNGDPSDVSGHGNNGTLQSGAFFTGVMTSPVEPQFLVLNSAKKQFIQMPTPGSSIFNLGNLHAFTAMAWVKTSRQGNDFLPILAKFDAAAMTGWAIGLDNSGGGNNGPTGGQFGFFFLASGTPILGVEAPQVKNDGGWHLVAATYDGSGSANGVKLYIDGLVATNAVVLVDSVASGSLTKLTDGSSHQAEPSVSRDGRRLLFTRIEEDTDIVELPIDGSPSRKLLATNASEYSPTWSPKGSEFAYLTRRNGNDELWLRSIQGDWERPIVTAKEFPSLIGLSNPEISPDGSRIAYWAIQGDPSRPSPSTYISPTAGGTPTWVARGGATTWSPDGAFIAFVWNTPSGAITLGTLRIGSNQPPFEIPKIACTDAPVWSPSGEWIACTTPGGPMLVSPDGKVSRTLPRLNAVVMAWSKDSQTLYGLHVENGSWSLLAQDIRSGEIRKVSDYGSALAPFAIGNRGLRLSLSPDGTSLAIGTMKRQRDLWTLEGFAR